MWLIIFAAFGGFMLGIVTAGLLNAAKTADEWDIREMPGTWNKPTTGGLMPPMR